MRKVIRWAFVSVAVLCSMVAAAAWMLFQASRHEPSFYRQALLIQPTRAAEDGAELEHEVLELRNDTLETGNWEAAFTAEQLNGWMAVDLPEKFPTMLPRGLEEPRVAIEDGVVRVAARYRDRTINSIVSFALELQLADEPNTVAICIREVRAGALPVPIATWLDKVQKAIGNSDLVVHWSQSSDDPVALVQIPVTTGDSPHRQLTVGVPGDQGWRSARDGKYQHCPGDAGWLGVGVSGRSSATVQGR